MKKLLLLSLPLMAIAGFNVWSEALAEPARIQRPGIVVPNVTGTGPAASVDIPSGSAAIPVAAIPKSTRAASPPGQKQVTAGSEAALVVPAVPVMAALVAPAVPVMAALVVPAVPVMASGTSTPADKGGGLRGGGSDDRSGRRGGDDQLGP
jgi:hypothetical protein